MAAKFDFTNFTVSAEEVRNISEIVVQYVFEEGNLNKIYDIQTGITSDKQIAFIDGFGVVGKAISGCVPESIGQLTPTELFWSPKLMGGRLEYCPNDETKAAKWFKQAQNTFSDFFDRNKDAENEFKLIAGILMNAIQGSILPKAWFSDTAADDFTGGGTFTDGTDLDLFNQIDGLWKQIFADAAIPRYTITVNAGATYALQALTAGSSLTILRAVYNGAKTKLRNNPSAYFLVTQDIYDDLLAVYEDKAMDNGGLTLRVEDGSESLKFRGKPVYVENSWDETIGDYKDNGTIKDKPHRVVFTVKEAIPIGTTSKETLSALDMFYDRYHNVNVADFAYKLDAKLLRADLISVAY